MSKNAPTIAQIQLCCRHVVEMRATGMTENVAIRLLELLCVMYCKFRVIGKCTPDHVDQFTHWSKAGRLAKAANPTSKPGSYLRVEHGTPRRDFARDVLEAYKANTLTEDWLNNHCAAQFKVAVVTHEEDKRLNKLKGKRFATPDERWAAVNIDF